MTNSTVGIHAANRQAFEQLLREHHITDLHGLELLRLVHMLANAYETVNNEHLSHARLSGPRWSLLLRLWGAEQLGAPFVHPTQLSHTQNVSKNTISSHLRSLEEQGLIERAIDPSDKRQFHIRLSERGRALVQAVTSDHLRFLNHLTADLSPTDVEQLQQLLLRLYQSLVKHGNLPERCVPTGRDE
jgi:DNA-binding MarR family transcriptional regulator